MFLLLRDRLAGSADDLERAHESSQIAAVDAIGGDRIEALPPGYGYYDPYCRGFFPTLVGYRSHCGAHRHAMVIRVVERDQHLLGARLAGLWRDPNRLRRNSLAI